MIEQNTIDFGAIKLVYNSIIGILLLIGSKTIGEYAGWLIRLKPERVSRLTHIATKTFGAIVALLSVSV